MYTFCTYFDANYLLRGLALYRSLVRHVSSFRLYVLCLDDETHAVLGRMALPEIVPIALAELEAADAELLAAKATRSRVEYYFTCTGAFVSHVFALRPDVDMVTYLDADLYFYADPAPMFEELGSGSVLIVPHRFPQHLKHLEAFGRYNVGLLTFRNDETGRACLASWRRDCITWCYDRLEDGRFGDQKYLDAWPDLFTGVVELRNKGANLAPWNLAGYTITERDGAVMVDDDPLIFHHFHKLKAIGAALFDAGVSDRRARLGGVVRRRIYAPYLRELRGLMPHVGTTSVASARRVQAAGLLGRLRHVLEHRSYLTLGTRVMTLDLEPLARVLRRLKRIVRR